VNVVHAGLLAQLVLAGLAVVMAVCLRTERARALAAGSVLALLAGAGVLTGALTMGGHKGALTLPIALPMGPVTLAPDRLGGVFMLVASAVGVLVAVFAVGYARSGPAASRTSWAALAVFEVAMQLVPAGADLVAFMLAWELMALASTILVLTDRASRPQVRSAALWYAAMTQLSFLLVLAGFSVLASTGGSTGFAQMASAGAGPVTAAVAFVLLVLGFGTKAGLVPLHVWLPRAHAEAPSHVSAAMSAAMVSMGVYGMVLVCVRLLPGGPAWWGVLLVALGAVSALYGILQASVASDVKRLLAYSTTENVGLIVLALGASVLLRAHGALAAADAAVTACLLLVVSHAAFKVTLFLGAGAVLHATGERDLDRLGGLGPRMPWTGGAFGVAALGAAALPVTCGFVAEWTLLQALIHGSRTQDRLVTVVMPLAVAVVALTAGLALLTFVKAFGIAFLARPRSDAAAAAREAPAVMRLAVVAGAVSVLVLGLVPGPVGAGLAAALGARGVTTVGLGGLDLSALGALLDPVALAFMAGLVALPVLVVVVASARRHPRRMTELAWGGGGARVSPRMQYTATSYAEPLVRVFDDALQPSRDVQVTHLAESRYLVERMEYSQHLVDVVEVRAYRPVLRWAGRMGRAARRLQNGSIHRYLAYSFLALLAVLVVVRL
jgi:hydrogenase-4 component B